MKCVELWSRCLHSKPNWRAPGQHKLPIRRKPLTRALGARSQGRASRLALASVSSMLGPPPASEGRLAEDPCSFLKGHGLP